MYFGASYHVVSYDLRSIFSPGRNKAVADSVAKQQLLNNGMINEFNIAVLINCYVTRNSILILCLNCRCQKRSVIT